MKATIDAKINLVTASDGQKCHQIKYNTDSRKAIQSSLGKYKIGHILLKKSPFLKGFTETTRNPP